MSTSRNTLDLWRLDDGDGDTDSLTVQHMYALCEQLHVRGHSVPPELGFVMSPLGIDDLNHWPDCEYGERLDKGMLAPDEAARALRLLNRYLGILRKYRPDTMPEDPCDCPNGPTFHQATIYCKREDTA